MDKFLSTERGGVIHRVIHRKVVTYPQVEILALSYYTFSNQGEIMIELSTELLSRIQFAFTITFHGVFPTFNIGLGLFLVYWEYRYLRTNSDVYKKLCQFWGKIFALSFAMGVVSGVVLSYELGANFSGFTNFSGNVLGPLIMMETMSAFFLEAGFLGIMLFGWNKVSKKVHFLSTCMVALGTVISLLWIMSANSFMHTPAGFFIEEGRMVANSWMEVIFNPSYITRAVHMLLASVLSTSFVIMGIACYFFYRKRDVIFASASFIPALYIAFFLSFAQVAMGDVVGIMVLENQPVKTAAMEGNWKTQRGAPLVVFGIPDMEAEKNHYEVTIPKLASFINTHDWNGELPGLDIVDKSERPPVATVFFTFRIMVGIGILFVLLSTLGVIVIRKQRLVRHPMLLKAYMASIPLGFIATTCGWYTSEIGRQPWVIYGLQRTKEAVSSLPVEQVGFSLTLIFILYMSFFVTYLIFIWKVIQKGPGSAEQLDGLGYMIDIIGIERK